MGTNAQTSALCWFFSSSIKYFALAHLLPAVACCDALGAMCSLQQLLAPYQADQIRRGVERGCSHGDHPLHNNSGYLVLLDQEGIRDKNAREGHKQELFLWQFRFREQYLGVECC